MQNEMRPEPPQLTSGRKSDPLREAFHAPSSAPGDGRNALFKSPPPRFSDHGGAIVVVPRTSITPSHAGPNISNPYAASQITEVTAFSRSEVADKIRQSFDALVKASPIGVPMTSRTAASPYPIQQRFPPLRSSLPAYPQSNRFDNLRAPHSAGGGSGGGSGSGQQGIQQHAAPAFPAQQTQQAQHQVVETHEFRRTVHSNSPIYGATTSTVRVVREVVSGGGGSEGGDALAHAHPAAASHGPSIEHPADAAGVSTFQCEEVPQEVPQENAEVPDEAPSEAAAAAVGVSDGGDPKLDKPATAAAATAVGTRPTSEPAAAAAQAVSESRGKRPGSASAGKRASGRSRELASLLTPHAGGHGHSANPMHLGQVPATMPVRGVHGDDMDEERTYEVSRFGRPRVKPLAYWSSERLVVGTKDAGAQGIDKGSAFGDLLGGGAPPSSKGRSSSRNNNNNNNNSNKGKSKATPTAGTLTATAVSGGRSSSLGGKTQSISMEEKPVVQNKPTAQTEQKVFSRDPARRMSGGHGGATLAAVAAAAGAEAAAAGAGAAASKAGALRAGAPASNIVEQPEIEKAESLGEEPAAPETEQKRSKTPPVSAVALPEVPGVPESVVQQIADMPSEDRPRKCGHCKSCLKPSLRKACETIRALGGNAPIPRGKNRLSLGAGGGGRKKRPPIVAGKEEEEQEDEEISKEQGEIVKGSGQKKGGTRQKRKVEEEAVRRSTRQRSASQQPGGEEGGAELATSTDGTAGNPQHAQQQAPRNKAPAASAAEKCDSGPWTAEQVAALHKGWLEVPPTASNFWQKVAAMVPGRTAAECFSKMYERHPTPPQKKGGHAAGAGGAGGSKKYRGGAVPELKAGASKHTLQNAARKFARQQRWQQRAEDVASVDGDEEEMVEALEEQQHRDRYIDQILRKRRGRALGFAPGRARGGPYADREGGKEGAGAGQQRAAGEAAAKVVQEALAAATAKEDENADSDVSDYYWSDAE